MENAFSNLHYQKGDNKEPENHRGINLLNIVLMFVTKIITPKINNLIEFKEQQQGFRMLGSGPM